MTKINPSSLFEDAAEAGAATTVLLDRPFDIAPDRGLTHSVEELAELVLEAAGWLAAAGAGPGDRVAILKDNHWDSDLLAYAAIRIGALPAKIRSDLAPQALELLLRRLEPAVLVTTAATLETASRDGIDLAGLAGRAVTIDQPAPGALALEDVGGHKAPPRRRRGDDEPLIVCLTSGTTGVPKLAVHSTTTIIRCLAEFEARRYPFFGCR
ncbi:MAG TPA: AMP-binding protein, partial [Solirubrobacteraceae bacterium]|nr:AMP-binding protein [Solirubrobacteraceae bacterium]